jgi:hypothetical protein
MLLVKKRNVKHRYLQKKAWINGRSFYFDEFNCCCCLACFRFSNHNIPSFGSSSLSDSDDCDIGLIVLTDCCSC